MTSGEKDPLIVPGNTPGNYVPDLDDPELINISSIMTASIDDISRRIGDLTAEPTREEVTPVLTQEYVNRLAEDILGGEVSQETFQMSDLFRELSKPAGDRKYPKHTFLVNGSGNIVFTKETTRGKLRRNFGQNFFKTRRLVEYWQNQNISITKRQSSAIDDVVYYPLRTLAASNKAGKEKTDIGIEEVDQLISGNQIIDHETDLTLLKFLVFSNIVNILRRPEMREAYIKLMEGSETSQEIYDSPYGHIYRAALFQASLADEDPSEYWISLMALSKGHSKNRFLQIPSRQFNETMKELKRVALTYRRLDIVEKTLQGLPENTRQLRETRGKLVKSDADVLTYEAISAFNETTQSIHKVFQERFTADSSSDYPAVISMWQNVLQIEELRIDLANTLISQLAKTGISNHAGLRETLKKHGSPSWQMAWQEMQQEDRLQKLKPEIERCTAEFITVDELYHLSNKKLRERHPGSITLAKGLADSLGEQGPVDEEIIRGLTGLMLGVYWERTGQNSTSSERAKQYVEDVYTLRLLSGQLERLGQPRSSHLLKMSNLLDELIDSGLFDEVEDKPELEVFTDFVLDYMIARDRFFQSDSTQADTTPAEPETVESEKEPKSTESRLPLEAIRQAIHEDILVFPPGASSRDVMSDYARHIEEKDLPFIEWERIKKIIALRDQFNRQNLETSFIRTKHAGWQVLPFYVLEVRLPNDPNAVAVVESPVYGNATYIYREADDRLPWRDVVQLRRHEARELGAVSAVHVDDKKLDKHFKKIWNRVISELTVAR